MRSLTIAAAAFMLSINFAACADNPAESIFEEVLSSVTATYPNAAASILASALETVTVPYSKFTTLVTSTSKAPQQTPTAKPFTEPVAATEICTFVFTADWELGGGSPLPRSAQEDPDPTHGVANGGAQGQGNYNDHIFSFSISHGKDVLYSSQINEDKKVSGVFTVDRTHYKGNHNVSAGAYYDWVGVDWQYCRMSFDGGEYVKGKIHSHIEPDIVTSDQATRYYFLYGWGAQHGLHWFTIAVGVCLMIAHQVSACSVATAYAMDCFPGISGELVVILAVASSCINFTISETTQPFINAAGYGWPFTFYGLCVLSSMAMVIPMMVYGKGWRRGCKPQYEKFLSERGQDIDLTRIVVH